MILTEQTTDWWKGGIIYQIYPRSFQDTTGSGTGDLAGIAQRLPYVASLGSMRSGSLRSSPLR